jgi:hypothetical protein
VYYLSSMCYLISHPPHENDIRCSHHNDVFVCNFINLTMKICEKDAYEMYCDN